MYKFTGEINEIKIVEIPLPIVEVGWWVHGWSLYYSLNFVVCLKITTETKKAYTLELLNNTPWKNMPQTGNTGYFWREGKGPKIGSGINLDFNFFLAGMV